MQLISRKRVKDTAINYSAQRRFILTKNSNFQVQEAYKTLRANIRFALHGEGCKKFCITSSQAGEGKSITMLNLAISFAQTGQRVLLIDADLRRPSLAKLMVEKHAPGLSNVLAGLCTPEEAVRKEMYPCLDVLFSGEIPPNPSELLGSDSMKQLIEKMSHQYDYILVDMPPVGIVSDVCVAGSFLDGALYLVRQGVSEKDVVAKGIKQLELAGVRLLGFVFNGKEDEKRHGIHHYSYESK